MTEYRHHVLTKGTFHIVALTRDSEFEEDEVYAYAVLSSSGVKLWEDPSLNGAQVWLDDRILKELMSSGSVSPDMMSPSRPLERSGLRSSRKRR